MSLILVILALVIGLSAMNAGVSLRRSEDGRRDLVSWLAVCGVASVLCLLGREPKWLVVFLPTALGMLGGYNYDPTKKVKK